MVAGSPAGAAAAAAAGDATTGDAAAGDATTGDAAAGDATTGDAAAGDSTAAALGRRRNGGDSSHPEAESSELKQPMLPRLLQLLLLPNLLLLLARRLSQLLPRRLDCLRGLSLSPTHDSRRIASISSWLLSAFRTRLGLPSGFPCGMGSIRAAPRGLSPGWPPSSAFDGPGSPDSRGTAEAAAATSVAASTRLLSVVAAATAAATSSDMASCCSGRASAMGATTTPPAREVRPLVPQEQRERLAARGPPPIEPPATGALAFLLPRPRGPTAPLSMAKRVVASIDGSRCGSGDEGSLSRLEAAGDEGDWWVEHSRLRAMGPPPRTKTGPFSSSSPPRTTVPCTRCMSPCTCIAVSREGHGPAAAAAARLLGSSIVRVRRNVGRVRRRNTYAHSTCSRQQPTSSATMITRTRRPPAAAPV